MICMSLGECLELVKPREVVAVSSPLGGRGLLSLAESLGSVRVLTSGPVANKVYVLDAVDNYGADVRFVPRLAGAFYLLRGERTCLAAGPPLTYPVVRGATAPTLCTCGEAGDPLERLAAGGRPLEAVDSAALGGGRDGADFDALRGLRRLQPKGEDEEEVADWIVRSGALGVDDPDMVADRFWGLLSRWRGSSAALMRDPAVGLPVTVSMAYHAVRAVAVGNDCGGRGCLRTTVKVVERALARAPQSPIHDRWREALRDPAARRRIDESPYIPALLMLTGRVEVSLDRGARLYRVQQGP